MFYCETCRSENGWPESFSRSIGHCEMCNSIETCYSMPSSSLPKKEKNMDNEPYKEDWSGFGSTENLIKTLRKEIADLKLNQNQYKQRISLLEEDRMSRGETIKALSTSLCLHRDRLEELGKERDELYKTGIYNTSKMKDLNIKLDRKFLKIKSLEAKIRELEFKKEDLTKIVVSQREEHFRLRDECNNAKLKLSKMEAVTEKNKETEAQNKAIRERVENQMETTINELRATIAHRERRIAFLENSCRKTTDNDLVHSLRGERDKLKEELFNKKQQYEQDRLYFIGQRDRAFTERADAEQRLKQVEASLLTTVEENVKFQKEIKLLEEANINLNKNYECMANNFREVKSNLEEELNKFKGINSRLSITLFELENENIQLKEKLAQDPVSYLRPGAYELVIDKLDSDKGFHITAVRMKNET